MSSAGILRARTDAPATRQRQLVRAAAGTLACALVTVLVWTRPEGWLGTAGFVTVAVAAAALVWRTVRLAQTEADAQRRLDALRRESAESRERLEEANAELRARNAQLVAVHISFADLLNLADERSGGHMRLLIESTGEELAEWLERQIDGHAKLDWPGPGAQSAGVPRVVEIPASPALSPSRSPESSE